MKKRLYYAFPLLLLAVSFVSCNYVMKVRDGRMAYEVKQYAVAVDMLQKEYDKAKTRIEKGQLAYLMGLSYKELHQSEESIQWFQTAYDYGAGVDALKEMAYALKRSERYKEAIDAFKTLGMEIGSPYEYRREINACEVAVGWKNINYPEYRIEVSQFNSGDADYAPFPYKDNQLIFTSDRQKSTGDETYKWTGNAFSDLFVVDLGSNAVSSFNDQLNTTQNEGTIALNDSYTEVFFTRCYGGKNQDAYCKIMKSQASGESWSTPTALDFIQDGINYGHPSLSADGRSLYFSCNHPDGWGGYDIWVSERTEDGEWGPPLVLGRSINTIGNEKFPTVDNDTLYFSSDFHTGMGGLDIFKTYKLNNDSWAPAYNLKPPVNSGADDFGYIVDRQSPRDPEVLQVGYFTSTRDEGIGGDDIYRFEKITPPEPEIAEEEPEELEYKMVLNGYVLEKIYETPNDPNSRVLGRRPLDSATVNIAFGNKTKEVTVGEDGFFSLELEEGTDYEFLARKENYLTNDEKFSTKGVGKDPNNPVRTFEVEIVLDKIFIDKEIVLENIYYDFDKWDIRDDAKPTLNELAKNLKLNPEIDIQMGSHTDCRGSNSYNQQLSQKRAQSAVDYLISQGIDPGRLEARGYGESQPAVDCVCSRCTEDEHQLNRRTTFKIVDPEFRN